MAFQTHIHMSALLVLYVSFTTAEIPTAYCQNEAQEIVEEDSGKPLNVSLSDICLLFQVLLVFRKQNEVHLPFCKQRRFKWTSQL